MVDKLVTANVLSIMIDERDDDFLETNIKGMMMTLLARWNSEMDRARSTTEFAKIRPSDMRVFALLRGRTVKLSKIHKEMGFSRQAAQQAIDRLVEQGLLAVEFAPGSNRDKSVKITDKGQRWRSLAAKQIREIEATCAKAIGNSGKENLRALLLQLIKDAPK